MISLQINMIQINMIICMFLFLFSLQLSLYISDRLLKISTDNVKENNNKNYIQLYMIHRFPRFFLYYGISTLNKCKVSIL